MTRQPNSTSHRRISELFETEISLGNIEPSRSMRKERRETFEDYKQKQLRQARREYRSAVWSAFSLIQHWARPPSVPRAPSIFGPDRLLYVNGVRRIRLVGAPAFGYSAVHPDWWHRVDWVMYPAGGPHPTNRWMSNQLLAWWDPADGNPPHKPSTETPSPTGTAGGDGK